MSITTVADVASSIEEFAPLALQASYDNSGLIVGLPEEEVRGVVIAVDLTEEVIDEAVALGANMIVTHHPIIFIPLKRLTQSSCVERCVEMALRNNIAVYAAHTNLDSAEDGMSWRVGKMLGLSDMAPLDEAGYGVVGNLATTRNVEAIFDELSSKLRVVSLRHSDITTPEVRRVAICTGSGGSLLDNAVNCGAELYITADLRYNDFFSAQKRLTIADVGHYESEYCVIEIIFDILSKKMFNFALHKSLRGANPVNYRVY